MIQNVVNFVFLGQICAYTTLNSTVKGDKGETLGPPIQGTVKECEVKCDGTQNCESFTYNNQIQSCELKDKKLNGTEELKDKEDTDYRFTVFKKCDSGMYDQFRKVCLNKQ